MKMVRHVLSHLNPLAPRPRKVSRAEAFRDDPQSPWLISFPRTGSHWLRMMLEQYADRPVLPRSFFEHKNDDYLLNHSHDYEFALRPKKLIYLYRDPVPVVFSQIKFHEGNPEDAEQVTHWATLYRLHLRHWLTRPHDDRTIVKYEDLQNALVPTLSKVLSSLNLTPIEHQIRVVAATTNKTTVTSRTRHDPRVMNTEVNYEVARRRFTTNFADMIHDLVIEQGDLGAFFAAIEAKPDLKRAA